MSTPEPVWLTQDMWMRNLVDLGTLSIDYLELAAGSVRTPVIHVACDEISYILSGELEFHLDGEAKMLKAGDCIAIPRGIAHGSVNHGPETVRMLAVNSPAFRLEDEVELSEGEAPR